MEKRVMEKRVIAIVGPTAAGKSALALELASRFDGEIVNADALQVYRGFDVGTAKPSLEERQRVPHHLVDVLDPGERYSAGEFARRARVAIAGIQARGRLPLVVGGSGLYLRALFEGISPIPPGDPVLRRELEVRLAAEGLAALRRELEVRDPETAARLGTGDTQRILRALEVEGATGRPLSQWIRDQPFGERRLDAFKIGLTLPREVLYHRIEGRVRSMLDAGWVGEVEALLRAGVGFDAPAFQAIGYKQLVLYSRGELPFDQAFAEIVRATRRFAKRQMTWFRKEPGMIWFDARDTTRDISTLSSMPGWGGFGGSHGEAQH